MEIWTLISSLAGVALGWALTQTSTWLGTRQADQRVAKEVLYFLLELHRLFYAIERVNRAMPQVLAIIRRYTTAPPPEFEAAVNEALETWLREIMAPLVGQQLATLKGGYDAGLLKLATIDPVYAYRLRGLDELLQKVPKILGAVEATKLPLLDAPLPMPAGAAAFMQQHFEAEDIPDALVLVQEVMQELAQRLDRRTRQMLATELAREQGREQELLRKYEDYLAKALAAFPPLGGG